LSTATSASYSKVNFGSELKKSAIGAGVGVCLTLSARSGCSRRWRGSRSDLRLKSSLWS